jgi:pimeloyl-ACP methyl ester carboxylesterase
MTRSNTFRGLSTAVVAIALLVATAAPGASQQKNLNRGVTNIVLVHGAWADGSSWSKVIPLLEARGLQVVAVQLPLTSQADDVATVQRAIALVDGPLLLVAHSYGGSVITQAGNEPKVAGLVYVAAFAPAEGESPFDLAVADPTPALQQLQQDQFGFLKLTSTGIREDFAQDLSESEQTVLAATQGPTSIASLSAAVTTPAWRNKALLVCDRGPRPRRCADASGDVRGTDERHVNHAVVQPRGRCCPNLTSSLHSSAERPETSGNPRQSLPSASANVGRRGLRSAC